MTHPATFSSFFPHLFLSAFHVTVYATPAPSPPITSSLRLLHAVIGSGANTSCHTLHPRLEMMMRPVDTRSEAGRRVQWAAGRQVEFWVINEKDLASLKTKEF